MGAYKDFNDAVAKPWTLNGWMFLPFLMAVGGIAIAPALAAAGAASTVAAGGAAVATAANTTAVATTSAAAATTIGTSAATVSNGAIWLQWFSPFFTDPITGAQGLQHGLTNIFTGVGAYATSGYELASSGIGAAFDPNVGVFDAVSTAWNAPNALPGLVYG